MREFLFENRTGVKDSKSITNLHTSSQLSIGIEKLKHIEDRRTDEELAGRRLKTRKKGKN